MFHYACFQYWFTAFSMACSACLWSEPRSLYSAFFVLASNRPIDYGNFDGGAHMQLRRCFVDKYASQVCAEYVRERVRRRYQERVQERDPL